MNWSLLSSSVFFWYLFGNSCSDDWEWNADGDTFWDDDDNYWAGDDELAYAPIESEDKGRMNDGAGSIFINAMQSIVYLVGIVFCCGGLFMGYSMYKTGSSPVLFYGRRASSRDDDPEKV